MTNLRKLERPQNPEIRTILERALAEYDSGALTGIALVKTYDDKGEVQSDFSGVLWDLLNGCVRLQHRLNLRLDQKIEEQEGS